MRRRLKKEKCTLSRGLRIKQECNRKEKTLLIGSCLLDSNFSLFEITKLSRLYSTHFCKAR